MPFDPTDATGGTITYSSGKTIHTFTTSGTLTFQGSGNVAALLVGAGGGAGGGAANVTYPAAGGGGQVSSYASVAVTATSYSIVVSGAGAATSGSRTRAGSSTGLGYTALGGWSGCGYQGGADYGDGGHSGNGSYVGGQRANYASGGGAGNAGNGGNGGGDYGNNDGGPGGNGTASSISGSSVYYGGGGGGSGNNGTASNGLGGGYASYGGGAQGWDGRTGGPGIVIVSYTTGQFGTYFNASALAVTSSLKSPVVADSADVSSRLLSVAFREPLYSSSVVSTDGALNLSIYAPNFIIFSQHTVPVNELAASVVAPIPRASTHFDAPPYAMTFVLGRATKQRYIEDPIAAAGCPMCGTLLYTRRCESVKSRAIYSGVNADRGPAIDGSYVKCGRCGFMCNTKKNSQSTGSSRIGSGIKYNEIEV